MHDPEHAEDAAAARRLGGLRRRREGTLKVAYDLGDLGTHEGLLRYLEVGAFDLLQLDNGIARVRAIIALVGTGARLLDRDLEDRIAALERAMATRRPWEPSGPLVQEDDHAHD